jgi:NAD(P)-dependent dehydrogenase (short-subunit alcohol dehydrogenase family)
LTPTGVIARPLRPRTIAAVERDAGPVARSTRLGQLDLFVHCAGITRDGVLWKLGDEDWER